jgi:hypothetical protein
VLEEPEAIMTRRLREIDDADSIVPVGAVQYPTGRVGVVIGGACQAAVKGRSGR